MVQWEVRLEGEVKARTCKVRQAKKRCFIVEAMGSLSRFWRMNATSSELCPGDMGKMDMDRSPDESEALNINSLSIHSFVPPTLIILLAARHRARCRDTSLMAGMERQHQMLGAATAGPPPSPPLLCSSPRLSPSYPVPPPPCQFLTIQTFNELFSRFLHRVTSWKRPRNTFWIRVGTGWAHGKGGTTFRNRKVDR